MPVIGPKPQAHSSKSYLGESSITVYVQLLSVAVAIRKKIITLKNVETTLLIKLW